MRELRTKIGRRLLAAVALAFGTPAAAQPAAAPVDYSADASWLCRPGHDAACTTGLDAMRVDAAGKRTLERFVAATNPPIDCFYVYPTTSSEPTPFSTMTDITAEQHAVRAQAARLGLQCRVFAPLYRQITMAGLRHDMATGERSDWHGPYLDVAAAWHYYLAHDNHGRGVVLIGHSQGTILLQRLVANEIDGRAAEARIVSVFLAGDPSLSVPAGAVTGGTFSHLPLCAAAAQTGCAYVWGSYLAGDTTVPRHFGAPSKDGGVAACVSPAAPGGGKAMLKAYLQKPATAPADDPPWIAVEGQLSGECVADNAGNVLRVTIEPGRYAGLLAAAFGRYADPGWGLHPLDLGLEQGNIIDVVAAEAATWTTAHRERK